jgi:hypothetical protein
MMMMMMMMIMMMMSVEQWVESKPKYFDKDSPTAAWLEPSSSGVKPATKPPEARDGQMFL